ncbi:amidohydrolase [Flavobacterium magnesitis]|uniref:amidohydrolase n=1 Tax=Flavobacterium magnesitis TaxID=3138077 RepID=UPI00358F4CD1
MEHFNQYLDTLISLRKELHQNPEVSGEEEKTAQRIVSFLAKYPPDKIIENIGKTGVAAIYNSKNPGKKVLFRAELDALPIEENNDFDYQSVNKGVSHKCGHDGHMAILCGLAIALHHKRPETGSVILLFQPAEEDGSGAQKVISDDKFGSIQPDYVFALHNLPGYPKNQIVVKNNTFSCAVGSIIIKLKGIIAHAGEPENGINPALAIASIISEYNKLIEADISKDNYQIITPIYIQMGEKAYGISAGEGEVHFTVRSNGTLQMKKTTTLLETIAEKIAKEHQLDCEIDWIQNFEANENNSEAVNFVRKAAKLNHFELLEKENPFSWGEDFGLFTQQYSGAMFGIGAGIDTPSLHNPNYDFPDDILQTGISVFNNISKQITDAN